MKLILASYENRISFWHSHYIYLLQRNQFDFKSKSNHNKIYLFRNLKILFTFLTRFRGANESFKVCKSSLACLFFHSFFPCAICRLKWKRCLSEIFIMFSFMHGSLRDFSIYMKKTSQFKWILNTECNRWWGKRKYLMSLKKMVCWVHYLWSCDVYMCCKYIWLPLPD